VKNSMADYDLANDPHGRPALFRLEAVMKMTDPANIHNAGFPGWGDAVESNELAKILRKIDVQGAANALALTSLHAKIDALTAKVNSLVAPTPGGQPFTPAQLAQIQGVVEAAEDS
jgi:hypothetical protein